jgi:hypothetical protein
MEKNWLYLDGLSVSFNGSKELMNSTSDQLRCHQDLKSTIDGIKKGRTDGMKSRMSSQPVDLFITVMFSYVSRRTEWLGESLAYMRQSPNDSVFASRVATSGSHFNKRTRTQEWDRYAARLSGPSSAAPDPDRNQVSIPWPALKLPKLPNRESQTGLSGV